MDNETMIHVGNSVEQDPPTIKGTPSDEEVLKCSLCTKESVDGKYHPGCQKTWDGLDKTDKERKQNVT